MSVIKKIFYTRLDKFITRFKLVELYEKMVTSENV